ncbi:hypothetical protein JCGZ_05523 [Jatropha curcas]|uniref:Uncharacterized protein n=1 Tax=Jatropha curcas TaxID=180498 RepID=A0A067L6F6_JATCU|nr:hypothetical protein JCGZ_05523 [Jatropha curcas]
MNQLEFFENQAKNSKTKQNQGARILYASLPVFGHHSTRARWRSTRLVLRVSSPASPHAERASIDAKWSHSFLTVGVHQLPAIHAVAGDCSVKGGRSLHLLNAIVSPSSITAMELRKGIRHGRKLKHLSSPIRPVRGPILLN